MKNKLKRRLGEEDYTNKNCWLVKNLNYSPSDRCRYCELKFIHCPFYQYLIISLFLFSSFFITSLITEEEISRLTIFFIFSFIIIYGYFFNRSTEKVIKAYFEQRKAKEALEKLSKNLQKQVYSQTKDLRRAYERLKKLDKAKSEFISIASHQLRTPITAIKGYISMILEGRYGKVNMTVKKKIKNVFSSVERLGILVNTLLNLSRIESGRVEMNPEKESLEEIVEGIVKELKYNAENKGISLEYKKPKKKIPKILLDRGKIKESIINVIDNAIKYTYKGKVIVSLEKKKSEVIIKVKDTGAGMTKKEIKNLFTSFTRGSGGKRLYTEGTGLGLYISKKFIDLHKGKIWAESEGKEKGSTFYIQLPIN